MITLPLLASSYGDIRAHKWLALRAILTGWAAFVAMALYLARPLADLDFWLYAIGWADIRVWWMGGQTPLAHFLIGGLLMLITGYIVGRLHREHRTAMVLVFFLSLTIGYDLPRVVITVLSIWNDVDRLVAFVAIASVDFVFLRLPILAGGIWGIRDMRTQAQVHRVQQVQ